MISALMRRLLVEVPAEGGFAGVRAGAGDRGQVGAHLPGAADRGDPVGDGLLVGVVAAAQAALQPGQIVAGPIKFLGAGGGGRRPRVRPVLHVHQRGGRGQPIGHQRLDHLPMSQLCGIAHRAGRIHQLPDP
ncbi:hypothetical protein AB0B56_41440 [Streptosporangium canum]|uniref:hypothetical protein n=1 Tax=Streptosporangium canum TaxID=324952 RepID=UPI00344AAED7